jgi:hypothetical protein
VGVPSFEVVRPIVRSFRIAFANNASKHVRAGGHAVVWEKEKIARLVIPVPDKDDPHDLGQWSILDLGKERWTIVKSGPLRGLASLNVPRDCLDIVRARAERDSVFHGPTRTMALDCLECGACCKDNNVILTEDDVDRFRRGGRLELALPPYTKRNDGKLVLKLLASKNCQHLQSDNKCAIYTLRPEACSSFPAGSECCLFAREEELGLVDRP